MTLGEVVDSRYLRTSSSYLGSVSAMRLCAKYILASHFQGQGGAAIATNAEDTRKAGWGVD